MFACTGLLFVMACSGGGIHSDRFLGEWKAFSRNHMSISGDMVVEQDRITFSRKGTVRFEVVSFDGREYILQLSDVVDAGRIMRLGPVSSADYGEQMEVAYYGDADSVETPREHPHSGSASWGLYVR